MKLQSIEARKLLEIERQNAKDDKWIEHCICVGNSAGIIARALKEKGYDVDIDKTITSDIYTILANTVENLTDML